MTLHSNTLALLDTLKSNVRCIQEMPAELLSNEEFMLEAAKIHPSVLSYASEELKNNKPFFINLLSQLQPCQMNSMTHPFLYASAALQDDEDVVLLATQHNELWFRHASLRLRTNVEFRNKAFKNNSWYPFITFNKILKNTLWEGIEDAFKMMMGNYGLIERLNGAAFHPNGFKYGLVDVTLIPKLSYFLIQYGLAGKLNEDNAFRYVRDNERWNDKPTLRWASFTIGVALQFVRLILAAMTTVLVIPLIVLVHMAKYPYVYLQDQALQKLEGDIYKAGYDEPTQANTTLKEFMTQTHSSLNDLYASNDRITSTSADNTTTDRYGRLVSQHSILFFKPSTQNTSIVQTAALATASQLGIDEQYDPNDFYSNTAGRGYM